MDFTDVALTALQVVSLRQEAQLLRNEIVQGITKQVSIALAPAPRDHDGAARPRGTTGKRRGPRRSSR